MIKTEEEYRKMQAFLKELSLGIEELSQDSTEVRGQARKALLAMANYIHCKLSLEIQIYESSKDWGFVDDKKR